MFVHDPDERLDYAYDFGPLLVDGETVTAHDVTASEGVTLDGSARQGAVIVAWVSAAVTGTRTVTYTATTSEGRTHERTITLYVSER